jgi:hypothetical protein
MPFNSGTGITDHIDMLDKLIEIIVDSRHLESVAVAAGGTGYLVGDILGLDATGATSTIVAQLEVTSVSGGVIDGIRVYRSGAYTVDPTNVSPNTITGGTGSGATMTLTMVAAKWAQNRRTQEALSAAIGSGGTGYTVGDQITVTNVLPGVQGFAGADAVFNVDTEAGGVVTAVSLVTAGNYEEVPANDVATTGGTGGDDCTLTVTWQDATFANNEEQVCMLQGEGLAGADEIHVMLRPYSLDISFDTAYNWSLMGTTGYSATLPIHTQPGVNNSGINAQINGSTGALPVSDIGAYFPLKNDDADPDMEWWLNWNGRRIILVVKVESSTTVQYSSMYVGFINQLATDTEYPYPLLVGAGTTDRDRLWFENVLLTGGIVESIQSATADPKGPMYLRYPDGVWTPHCAEGSSGGTGRTPESEWGVYPFMNQAVLSQPKQIVIATSGMLGWVWSTKSIIPTSGVPGTESVQWKPTPGTGDDYYRLVAPLIIRAEINQAPLRYNMFGEIDGVFHFNRGGNTIVSEDRFVIDAKRYTIFQNGNRTQNWSYFALDED